MNNFNVNDFLNGAFHAPIQEGLYPVEITALTVVRKVSTEDGTDKTYVHGEFKNTESGRVYKHNFFGKGIEIMVRQLRNQLEDTEEYESVITFMQSVIGKEVTLYIERTSYEVADGSIKSGYNFHFDTTLYERN